MTEKSSDAFRTISEVADDLHVPQHVLRFWEGRFPQIKPLKRAGGRRYYRPEDIELLARIRDLLYTQGYTIKGVQNLLKDGLPPSGADAPPPASPHEEEEGEEGRPSFVVATESEDEGEAALPPPVVRAPEAAPLPAKPDTVSVPPMFGLFSRPEPPPPAVAPQSQAIVPTGFSKGTRDQLAAIMEELEQLRFLLRAQD